MNKLASQLIKLGHTHPELRPHLRPILDKIAADPSRDEQKKRDKMLTTYGKATGLRVYRAGGPYDPVDVPLGEGTTIRVQFDEERPESGMVLLDLVDPLLGRTEYVENARHLPQMGLYGTQLDNAQLLLKTLKRFGYRF